MECDNPRESNHALLSPVHMGLRCRPLIPPAPASGNGRPPGEIAAVHAMATTHPAALILASGDFGNPWLAKLVRRVLHPVSGAGGDSRLASVLRPSLASAFARAGRSIEDLDAMPDRTTDAAVRSFCPRCHGVFVAGVETCGDCQGMRLRSFDAGKTA